MASPERPSPSARWASLALLWVLLTVACAGNETPDPTHTPTPNLLLVNLPADEAPHTFATEWWYFNAHLQTKDQEQYALHYVVFQVASRQHGLVLHAGQAAVADPQAGRYIIGERIAGPKSASAGGTPGFHLRVGEWLMEGADGEYRLRADLSETSFDLDLWDTGQVLFHGGNGLVDFGEAGMSYYYSRPRLTVAGTLNVNGVSKEVTGLAWLDKQWGDFEPLSIAWDWASVQLDSGLDLMLTKVVDAEGGLVKAYGTLGRADGTFVHLSEGDFTFLPRPGETWESPRTGAVYPTEWEVTVPKYGVNVVLEPLLRDSEYVSNTLGVVYWEAGVSVSGTQAGMAVSGQGFVELKGRTRRSE